MQRIACWLIFNLVRSHCKTMFEVNSLLFLIPFHSLFLTKLSSDALSDFASNSCSSSNLFFAEDTQMSSISSELKAALCYQHNESFCDERLDYGDEVDLVGKDALPCVCEVNKESQSLFTDQRACVVADGVRWQSLYLVFLNRYMLVDPCLQPSGKLDFRLSRQLASYSKADPPPTRVKPIPLPIIARAANLCYLANTASSNTIADMLLLGFFFLLRPGEYAYTDNENAAPFRLCDMHLLVQNRRSLPLLQTWHG